jgi:plastocyanin
MASASAGNLTLVIPRALLDKLEPNGNDDQFGVIANRAVGFEETSTTPTSRTLVVQFDPGVNYIHILGTKSIEPKIKQALLPSFTKTNNSKTPTNMAETTSKLQVPLTEPKPPMNDTSSQTGGSTVSIVPGSSAPSNGKYYAPETIAISKGTSVAWINDDVTLHTVTSGAPGEGNIGTEFDSSFMDAGKTFEHAFDTAGTFDYFCTLHPFMTGKVKVQ